MLGLRAVSRFAGEQVRTDSFLRDVKSMWVARAAALESQYYVGRGDSFSEVSLAGIVDIKGNQWGGDLL